MIPVAKVARTGAASIFPDLQQRHGLMSDDIKSREHMSPLIDSCTCVRQIISFEGFVECWLVCSVRAGGIIDLNMYKYVFCDRPSDAQRAHTKPH